MSAGSPQRSSIGSVAVALGMAEVDAEVPGRGVVVAAAMVVVAVAASSVVMGVPTVDILVGDSVAVPVCMPPRKLPAATEMPTSNRRKCIMPRTEAFGKSGAIFCLMDWSRMT
jgi:hypothetical protein